ncbi:MAG: hypothetical protein ACYDAD_06280 [Acidimicrobiales bacterium]
MSSRPDTDVVHSEEVDVEDVDADVVEPAGPRTPRSRLTGALVAIMALGIGLYGGVRFEKRYATISASAGASNAGGGPVARFGAGPASGGAGARVSGRPGGAGGAGRTFGQVDTIEGSTLLVRDSSGNTVKVLTDRGSSVMKVVAGTLNDILPDDTVVIQGRRNPDGSITATQITVGAGPGPG